ncbi:MFS transporter [Streptomyces sp. NPDC059474]|uniref:MFS transporter n=2 Tax=unclassified Streptomyces TaxID=2593676 RepID=UPI0036ADEE27
MTTRTVSPEAPVKVHRVIVAASIGNALEWFDILVYGFFAATISKQFFPAADETVSHYIRRYVDEAGEFVKTADLERAPVKETFRTQQDRMLVAMGALAVSTAISYLITYMPTFAVRELDLPASTGFASTLVTGIVLTGLTPVVGHLSDRFGRTRIMLIFAALILALVYPSFAFLVAAPGFTVILGVMFLIGVLKAGYFAPLPAMMAELFPVTSRATGLAVSYNIAVMLFGGTTPLVIVWLVDMTGSKLAPTFYLMFLAVLSLFSVVFARRRLGIH